MNAHSRPFAGGNGTDGNIRAGHHITYGKDPPGTLVAPVFSSISNVFQRESSKLLLILCKQLLQSLHKKLQ
jgi:hypothetical protein